MQKINDTIYKMMMTSTGKAMCDSGFGERGRAWQRNQLDYPTIADIEKSPVIDIEKPEQWYCLKDKNGQFIRRFYGENAEREAKDYANGNSVIIEKETLTSADIDYTVSLYHHLVNSLELDATCKAFNALKCGDWDSEKAYGISVKQEKWLENHGLAIGNTWNSYNGESNLSQTIQGANIGYKDGTDSEYPEYILLQIHQGADVRGGYTDAKLFKVACEYFTSNPDVYGDIDGVPVSTMYDGNTLTKDDDDGQNGETVPVTPTSVISLELSNY